MDNTSLLGGWVHSIREDTRPGRDVDNDHKRCCYGNGNGNGKGYRYGILQGAGSVICCIGKYTFDIFFTCVDELGNITLAHRTALTLTVARCNFSEPELVSMTGVPQEQWQNYRTYQAQCKNNMAPGQVFPILYCDKHHTRSLCMMKWGIVPHFLPRGSKHDHFKMFNARIETVQSKPSFRNIINDQRCVVMLNGFFEWKVEGLGKKQPYYICRRDGLPLKLACIYEIREEDKQEPLITFSIITCSTEKSSLRDVHDRQPYFLTDEEVEEWIDNSMLPSPRLLAPSESMHSLHDKHESACPNVSNKFDDSSLQFFPVTSKMTSMQYQGDDVCMPVTRPVGINAFFQKISRNSGAAEAKDDADIPPCVSTNSGHAAPVVSEPDALHGGSPVAMSQMTADSDSKERRIGNQGRRGRCAKDTLHSSDKQMQATGHDSNRQHCLGPKRALADKGPKGTAMDSFVVRKKARLKEET